LPTAGSNTCRSTWSGHRRRPSAAWAAVRRPPTRPGTGGTPAAAPSGDADDSAGATAPVPAAPIDDDDEDAPHADSATSRTVYVKNLSFRTTEEGLRTAFASAAAVLAVRIPKRAAPASGDGALPARSPSMGFGFVECADADAARAAIRALRGLVLDGHALEPVLSRADPSATSSKEKKGGHAPSAKLMVRNVPFQADRTELYKLFGGFGKLRRVRLPKKFDGSHRGFAFVEFLTAKEAAGAKEGLSRTHLYGRHLVLEWAEDKEDLDAIRSKAKRDLELSSRGAAAAKNKKLKFDDDGQVVNESSGF